MWEDIVVSKKIIGHISSGIYRSPGGALKELVSNAFDADATRVVITTNWPSFDIITCRDNGNGMTLEEFIRIMKGGIGDSPKRLGTDYSKELNRPVIGWLGIGMLGVAQICHEFDVISHHKESKTAFRATIKLMDFLREKITDTQVESLDEQPLDVGKFSVEELEYQANQSGTYLIASDMRSAFVRKFRENPGAALPSKYSAFLNKIHKSRSINELGDYWQMIWDLSIASPIPYMDKGSFQWKNITCPEEFTDDLEALIKSLKDYKFEVVVDGLSLRKPNLYPYPHHKRDATIMKGKIFPIIDSLEVYGRQLTLFGYIYMQEGQAIEPFELRGLLLRIRNVAIGSYDPTFLKYPKIEGPRFNWLSSEIYIREGLEHALNIDRDSFNEMHPHYVKVQQIVHNLLGEVFSEASQGVKERSSVKKEQEQEKLEKEIQKLVSRELGSEVQIIDNINIENPIDIDISNKKMTLNPQHRLWPRAKSRRESAKLAAIAFEIAMLLPEKERRSKFYQILMHLINKT